MKSKFNFKLFALCSVALAFAACSDDNYTGSTSGNDLTDASPLKTASYLVGGGDQNRVANTGYWGVSSRSTFDYNYAFPNDIEKASSINKPDNALNYTSNTFDNDYNGTYVAYFPASETKYDYPSFGNNNSVILYVMNGAKVANIGSNLKNVDLYICTGGEVTFDYAPSTGTWNIYNAGTLHLPNGVGSNIKNIYNYSGDVYIGSTDAFGKILEEEVCIYSKGGYIEFNASDEYQSQWYYSNTLINGTIISDNIVKANGKIKFQSSGKRDICKLIATDLIEITEGTNIFGEIEGTSMKFDGATIKLHPEGYIHAIQEINIPNSACGIYAYENSRGLVETPDLNIHLTNSPLATTFNQGIYLQVEKIYDQASSTTYTDFTDLEVASQDHINKGVTVTPSCSADADGDHDDNDPEPTPDTTPSLDLVVAIEPATHDHDVDKTDEHRRHLSATSLTFDGDGNIYASYHMRGGNWAGDTYDKDDIEGCIERWSFDGENIEIGNWMWTNEFDFNHIILDGDKVITVGHKGGETEIEHNGKKYTDFGGIIGRMPTGVWEQNWDATDELKREDFEYKYLTTEVPLMGDFENESGNVTNQKVDYKSAGDGNCVVRAGDYYYVATSAGYGIVAATDSVFKRIKDETGKVLFTSTPGSAKYLVVNDDKTVNVLYLNDRAENGSEETTHFKATLAKITDFPSVVSTTTEMPEEVTPVDGKNVIAVDGEDVYACLSKGGLAKNGELFATFGEERSVNGVAVDDKYVYVANGSYITVLDKETAGVVVERKGNTKNVSANFVEVKDYNGQKYVFVAFGQDGIKVFKFTE